MDIVSDFTEFLSNYPDNFTRQISVFPTTVDFHPTYLNIPSNFTILIANPYHEPQVVNIEFNGDQNFSTSSSQYVIQPGEVRSCVVIFKSNQPGKFKTVMKVTSDNNSPCIVTIQAKCYQSPLIIPIEDIQSYEFNDISTDYTFTLINKSIIDTLHVVITPSSQSFSLSNSVIELKPRESTDVTLMFNPRSESILSHSLNIQCAESGDSYDLELFVGRIRNTITIDFGNSIINKTVTKKIKLTNSLQLTEVQPPFSIDFDENLNSTEITMDDDAKVDVILKYCSTEEGSHAELVEFEDFFLLLKGKSFKPAISIENASNIPGSALITNISEIIQKCRISFSENFENFTEFQLKPNEIKEIKMNDMQELFVSYGNNNEIINDHFEYKTPETPLKVQKKKTVSISKKSAVIPVTLNNDGNSPKNVTFQLDNDDFAIDDQFKTLVIAPHTTQSVNITYTPTKSLKSKASLELIDNSKNKITKLKLEGNLQLICDKPFIPFFGVSNENIIENVLTVTGSDEINVDAPEWLDCPDTIEKNHKLEISCGIIPDSSIVSSITFASNSAASISVPVIAYRGYSDLSISPPSDLEYKNGLLQATVEVINNGIRPGFVIFTGEENTTRQIHASPSLAIIPAAKKVLFKFIVDDGEGEVKAIMHSGDEIMRQIMSMLKPNSFYATAFSNAKIRDEIALFRENKKLLNENYFSKIFKKSITKKIIVFKEKADELDETEVLDEFVDEPSFALSETIVDFGNIRLKDEKEIKITIENLSLKPTKIKFDCSCKDIKLPKYINLKPKEQTKLPISLSCSKAGLIDEEIEIYNDVQTIPIKVCAEIEEPMVEIETLDFGTCTIGRLCRRNLKISNKKKEKVSIEVRTKSPFKIPVDYVEIESGCFVKFPVHFIPNSIGHYQDKLEFSPDMSAPFSVILIGSGENN